MIKRELIIFGSIIVSLVMILSLYSSFFLWIFVSLCVIGLLALLSYIAICIFRSFLTLVHSYTNKEISWCICYIGVISRVILMIPVMFCVFYIIVLASQYVYGEVLFFLHPASLQQVLENK